MSNQDNVFDNVHLGNTEFVMHMYGLYLANPNSVDASWQQYFANIDEHYTPQEMELLAKKIEPGNDIASDTSTAAQDSTNASNNINSNDACEIIKSLYRRFGHIMATLDPLGVNNNTQDENMKEVDTLVNTGGAQQKATQEQMHKLYSGNIGYEFMHIGDYQKRKWLRDRIESVIVLSNEQKIAILNSLLKADGFEKFLAIKFPGAKRFGLEGGETTICSLDTILETAVNSGVSEVVMGMAHRGRLNILHNIVGKRAKDIMSEFSGVCQFSEDIQTSGDVKYHMGASIDKSYNNGAQLHISLTPNPSHLEIVDPVVMGRVKAKQNLLNDQTGKKVLGILLHGDAAFAGQGVVSELLMMSQLKGYGVGGMMHVVTNNQIGFSTDPSCSRSSRYCSDIAKMIDAPIFHVNGDDPISVAIVSQLAMEYRQKFLADVVIDICCYRYNGHNEMDEPMFTQPKMYQIIKNKPTTAQLYCQQLIQEGVITQESIDKIEGDIKAFLEQEFEASKETQLDKGDWLKGNWQGFSTSKIEESSGLSSVPVNILHEIGGQMLQIPEDFNMNKKLVRLFDGRRTMLQSGQNIDWGMAEYLAFATLLNDGYNVRLSGQDSCRGTFSHRHSVVVDQENGKEYCPLQHLVEQKAKFDVLNSPLSEEAVLGFEYGYSVTDPNTLTIWEAQFGDFANGAQVIVDQFISCAEHKWLRLSGLVLLLPHGYEGQGPEHSSARLERYLQLCAQYNMQVVNITTPSNFFHVLRRQMHRDTRKPLIVMTPKSLLRHKGAVSNIQDFDTGTKFMKVISDPDKDKLKSKIQKIVFCSGKIFYELLEARREKNIDDVLLVRIEQLYPYPDKGVAFNISPYSSAKQVIWCQEESQNMGAWSYIAPNLQQQLKELEFVNPELHYVGRKQSASPATGYSKEHNKIQAKIVEEALQSCENNT